MPNNLPLELWLQILINNLLDRDDLFDIILWSAQQNRLLSFYSFQNQIEKQIIEHRRLCHSILSVCRSWNRIATPCFYSSLTLSYNRRRAKQDLKEFSNAGRLSQVKRLIIEGILLEDINTIWEPAFHQMTALELLVLNKIPANLLISFRAAPLKCLVTWNMNLEHVLPLLEARQKTLRSCYIPDLESPYAERRPDCLHLHFPNLIHISISRSEVLSHISTWNMPQLQMVNYNYTTAARYPPAGLNDFFPRYGKQISSLRLDGIDAEMWMLKEVNDLPGELLSAVRCLQYGDSKDTRKLLSMLRFNNSLTQLNIEMPFINNESYDAFNAILEAQVQGKIHLTTIGLIASKFGGYSLTDWYNQTRPMLEMIGIRLFMVTEA